MFSKEVHHTIFLLGTILLVIALPVSVFLLSVAILLVALNWILEGGLHEKLKTIVRRKSILILVSVYAVHLLWLFNTANYDYALHDLRIKMPLLAMPILYGTSPTFNKKEFRLIIQFFMATVLVATLISTFVIFGFSNIEVVDSRSASIFISHIRFSLMIVLSIYICLYFVAFEKDHTYHEPNIIYYIGIVWFVLFLLLLKSFTGIVILLLLPMVIVLWKLEHDRNKNTLRYSTGIMLILFLGLLFYSWYSIKRFHNKPITYQEPYDTHTVNGNPYLHDYTSFDNENGHKLWVYVCDKELIKEWNQRSAIHFHGFDRKGQLMRGTLLRYMSSKGLRKDSAGIAALTPTDVEMIENGYTNYIYSNKLSPYPRLYQVLWELEQYQLSGDPSGRSISQRIEYLKTGWNILKRHVWLGTGTGDIADEFTEQYILDNTQLKPQWQHRTHNQYLTFLISFGIFGFAWILFAFIAPPLLEKRFQNYFFLVFFCIGMLSMLNEDTLETHIGVSLFSFFYVFFLYSVPNKQQ